MLKLLAPLVSRNNYIHFFLSTHRWSTLTKHLDEKELTVKVLSKTKWTAHADAMKAHFEGYREIKSALDEINKDAQQHAIKRHEANSSNSLSRKMVLLETVFLCDLWNAILLQFNATIKSLQSVDKELKAAVAPLNSWQTFLESLRDRLKIFKPEQNFHLFLITRWTRHKKRKETRSMMIDNPSRSRSYGERKI